MIKNNHQLFISKITPPIAMADLESIAKIEKRCFGDSGNHPLFSPGLLIGEPSRFLQYFKAPEGCCFYIVYEEIASQQKIVAYMVTVPPSNREKEGKALGHCISNVGVDPDYQGRGIGLSLVMHFLNEVFQEETVRRTHSTKTPATPPSDDQSLAYLHVRLANHAENVYRACGFKRTMKRIAYYQHDTTYVFDNRTLLRRYKKEHIEKLNKIALSHYAKKMKPHHASLPEYVFHLILGQDKKTRRPTARLVADAYRMQVTYGTVREKIKTYHQSLEALPYKPYQKDNRSSGFFKNMLQRIVKHFPKK